MMKKLLLMMLLVVGGVMSASAAKLYVYVAQSANFWPNANARIMAHVWEGNDNFDVEMAKEIKYGNLWYSCELNGKTNVIIVRQDPSYGTTTSIDWDHLWARTGDITSLSTTEDTYGELWHNSDSDTNGVWTGTTVRPGTQWSGLIIRDSYVGFDGNTANTETTDYNTFTKTYTKAQIDEKAANANGKFYFKFKHVDGVTFDEAGTYRGGQWKEIHVSSDTEMSIGTSTDQTTQEYENGGNSWYITAPTYDYDRIIFTAKYVNEGGSYKWVISADAYISKTVSGTNQYATFGTTVPVNLSNLGAVTAYTVTADLATGIVSREQKTGNLAANEGVMLENLTGSDVTLSIPVAASADASSSNGLVAFTGSGNLTQPSDNFTYYILSKKNDKVGFYMVNRTSGNSMGANTAYLKVAGTVNNARESFFFDGDETTSIDAVKTVKVDGQAYNLNGQRVAQPAKGLYIVNGKKVIMK